MTEAKSPDGAENEVKFNRDAFLELASSVLTELRAEALKYQNSHELVDLLMMDIWKLSMPVSKNDLLSALFDRFTELPDNFDITTSAKNLYTLENLEVLIRKTSVNSVAQRFLEYFAGRMYKRWHVFIEVENLQFGTDFPELGTEDGSVILRQLNKDEREMFHKILIAEDRLNSFFFIAETQAGDAIKAVEKARTSIRRFLVPRYLQRMRNPDGWWRARTQRNILSPVSFYFSDDETGARRELKRLKGRANELFLPVSPMDEEWKTAVQSLASGWDDYGTEASQLEHRLRLCSRWMFAGETEEDIENAFLKHAVAWEGLLPNCSRIRRGWYLLLLTIGSCDPLCVKTVSQAGRLTDRRDSFAHPKIARQLYRNLKQDLSMLTQSLRSAFDNAIYVWHRLEQSIDKSATWSELLDRTFAVFCSEKFGAHIDDDVVDLLNDLILLEKDPAGGGALILTREGQALRVEALIAKSGECWWGRTKDPKSSVCHLARALDIAQTGSLPMHQYHVLLSLRDRLAKMDWSEFEEGWKRARVRTSALTANDIQHELEILEQKHGLRPESVGWKKP